jgi:hypothetical protein
MANTKATLRRMLGPPVPVEEKQPRKLEEMMDELNQTTALKYIGTPPVTPKPSKTWAVRVCAYAHKKYSTQVYFHFERGVEQSFPDGIKIERLDDEHWKLSRGGARFSTKGTRMTISYLDSSAAPFGTTKAEAVEADGAILVYLPKDNRAKVATPKASNPWPTQPTTKPVVAATPVAPTALTTKHPAPVPATLAMGSNSTLVYGSLLIEHMHDIIKSIQEVEASCPYRLVRLEGGRIQWRAPVIE